MLDGRVLGASQVEYIPFFLAHSAESPTAHSFGVRRSFLNLMRSSTDACLAPERGPHEELITRSKGAEPGGAQAPIRCFRCASASGRRVVSVEAYLVVEGRERLLLNVSTAISARGCAAARRPPCACCLPSAST